MSRAQTPVNLRRPPLDGIHSTPQSAGSGSNRNYDTQSTRLDYVPYLFQDLRNEKILPFEEFCKTILGLEIDQPKKATTKKLSDLLENYRLPIAKETERYEPFIQLANEVLDACCSEYRFVRNDPKYLWGIDAGRKPDVLLVHKFAWLRRNPILEGPEVPFHPCDIISFHEFKLGQKDLRRYSTLPPTSSLKHTSETSAPKRKASTSASTTEGRVRKSPRPGSSVSSVPRTKGSDIAAERNLEAPAEEDKTSNATLVEHPLIQCAGYALEMLSHGFRRHVLGFLATDGQIEFLYYDHSVVLRSSPFNFIDDLPQFQQIISHLGRMSFRDYGFYPEVIPATPDYMSDRLYRMEQKGRASILNTFDNLRLTLDDGTQLILGNIVYQAHDLIGRGSLVVNVKPDNNTPKDWGSRIIVKLSWLPASRRPEHEILKEIEQTATRLSATWVSDHLPKVFHSQVYTAPDGIVASLLEKFDDYEERKLYLLVMEGLECIDLVKKCTELKIAYKQIVRCHRWVYEEAQILHRDISVKNLMFRRGKDDRIQGVLNDFDLATPVAQLDNGPTSKQRTGTWPYLAIELLDPSTWLQPPRHLYRYDLESFFWVLLTLAVEPGHPDKHNILRWSTYNHAQLYDRKMIFLSDDGINTTPLQPRFKGLREWLIPLAYLFDDARTARKPRSSDTTVEMVTAESFLKLLILDPPGVLS
ncbi:Protein kinase domain-containing protein [Pleurotus pulmonarius]